VDAEVRGRVLALERDEATALAVVGYTVFGALGGLLGGLTLQALRRARFFAYLAEKR
jgi:hypothetical protein